MSLRDIKRRITSVRKTQQITSAMRMVAAAKLRKAQGAIESARAYADEMKSAVGALAAGQTDSEHPLLKRREKVRKIEVVVITSDRGLCGAFNSNIIKEAEKVLLKNEGEVESLALALIGRKCVDAFRKKRSKMIDFTRVGLGAIQYAHAANIAAELSKRYADGTVDEVVMVYSRFESAMSQPVVVSRLLPLTTAPAETPGTQPTLKAVASAESYATEPAEDKLLETLVPKAIEVEVFRALLEVQAGEHAARMAAMESATRNTEDMIGSLTLKYNRARQAAITTELIEIITGAEAL